MSDHESNKPKKWGFWKGHRYRVHSAFAFFSMHESLLRLVPQKYREHRCFQSGLVRRLSIHLQIARLELLLWVSRFLFRHHSLLWRTHALISYMRFLLEEKRLRDHHSRQTLSPAAIHAIKAQQIHFLNEHTAALQELKLLKRDEVTEISHLVLTMAASIRPGAEQKRNECLLSDRAEHLLDTLDCLKNMLAAKEAKRSFFRAVPTRWMLDPTWLDHLRALMKAFRLFRDSRGISDASNFYKASSHGTKQEGASKSEIQVAKNILRAHSMQSDEKS